MAKKEQVGEKPKRQRREQPVEIWSTDDSGGRVNVEHDGSVHDTASAVRFIKEMQMEGKFEIVRILGTVESKSVMSRKVVVG